MNNHTLSVIIPALNEEGNLDAAVGAVLDAIGNRFTDYELLIFDDGSTDHTGKIADELAAGNSHIRVIHNGRNRGFGYNYSRGVELATKEYVVMFPGDNEVLGEAMEAIFDKIGSADIVVPYIANPAARGWPRRLISSTFVTLLNLLFGIRLRYYNGSCVHRRSLLLSTPAQTHGFAYMASILVRMIRSGRSYIEVPMPIQPRQHGRSTALKLKNIISVLSALANLFWEVRVRDRAKYPGAVQRANARA
jgi:glycosyltransferase involved in cell wall biosynthesis